MNLIVRESFYSDFNKIRNKFIKSKILSTMDKIEKWLLFSWEINVKKLKWFDKYFRIRIWDYRIWLQIKDKTIIFERLLHRKDVYKQYP